MRSLKNKVVGTMVPIVLFVPISAGFGWGSIFSLLQPENAVQGNFEPNWAIHDQGLAEDLNSLAFCESSNRTDVVVVDHNGFYSRGCLQFQHSTFVQYTRKYGLLPYVEDEELKMWALDCEYSKYLASLMIQENEKNWYHWENCASRSLNLLD